MSNNRILTDTQHALLVATLNRLIPAEGDAPAAGSVGAAEAIEDEAAGSPSGRRGLVDGVNAIDLAAWRMLDRDFVDLDAAAQDDVLRAVEADQSAFFGFLVGRTYRAYYTNPAVLAALGIASRPPQPLGYTLPPFDPSLLARVRERGPIYRRIGDEE
ncbi:MAG TPA: gluconate 2-dehydrogenase subunit 3 family protein [Chloroflexota bacterium]|nr:gluconate 2-dehydrogenase subunit 3 family protein [Chloroflexota bacterium]